MIETKQSIRQFHKEQRAAMRIEEVREKSREICRLLLESDWYPSCKTLYAYYPLGTEADCRSLIGQALADGKRVALPRTRENCRMDFYQITSLKQVEEGHFHVMEPLSGCPLMEEQQGVILVPGVVFDRQGNRYGYGKGYYDRYFARFPGLRRMAAAYENQMEQKLEVLDTDVKMNRIYTERQVYIF